MKFLEQVYAYQKALIKKSRFFSSLMMISGIGLVAAAPFLSYEVSKIECYEKGNLPCETSDEKMIIYKDDLNRKDQIIADLENSVKSKEERIEVLINRANCDEVVRVIQGEKSACEEEKVKLVEEIKIIERERDVCREKLTICEEENGGRINEGNDCNKIEEENKRLIVERDRWRRQYEDCQRNLEEQRPVSDCSKIQNELNKCQERLAESNTINISGMFVHKEKFSFNNDSFIVNINSDDVGARYQFLHNNRNVTSRIRVLNRASSYSFKGADNKKYMIIFGRQSNNYLPFVLTTS